MSGNGTLRGPRRGAQLLVCLVLGPVVLGTGAGCVFDFDPDGYTYAGQDVIAPPPDVAPPDVPATDVARDGAEPGECARDEDCRDHGALPDCLRWHCTDAGRCEEWREEDATPCDDGDACTLDDRCLLGACVPGSLKDCADRVPCTEDRCAPESGACRHTADDTRCGGGGACASARCEPLVGCVPVHEPDGTVCDDENACTIGDACDGGACRGQTAFCGNSEDPCLEWICERDEGCLQVSATNGTVCEDDDPCTANEICQDGVCAAQSFLCACRVDRDCVPAGGENLCAGRWRCRGGSCLLDESEAVRCPDEPPGVCESWACLPDTGDCVPEAVALGSTCDDGDPDTVADQCGHLRVCRGWRRQLWRDQSRATRLTGVSGADDGFSAIGWSADAEVPVSAFVTEWSDDGGVGVPDTARRDDGRRYTRIHGDAAVDDRGGVTLRGVTGWTVDHPLAGTLAGPDRPSALHGVWTAETGAATPLDVISPAAGLWLSGRRADPPLPWLARCVFELDPDGTLGGWRCAPAPDDVPFAADQRLDGVVAFPEPAAGATYGVFAAGSAIGDGTETVELVTHGLYGRDVSAVDGGWELLDAVDGPAGSEWHDLHGSGRSDVWAVGSHGTARHFDGTSWQPVDLGLDDPASWDLNGVWSSGEQVFVAATRRGPAEGRAEATETRRFVVLHRDFGSPNTPWRRYELDSRETCPSAGLCAPPGNDDTLTDVWARPAVRDDGAGHVLRVLAVGHLHTNDQAGGPDGVVYRLDLD